MTSLSKLINENCKDVPCSCFFHPGTTCFRALSKDLINYIPGNIKLFTPMILIPLLMKYKKIDEKLLKESLWQYIEFLLVGYSNGLAVTAMLCLVRNCLQRFYFSTIAFLPSILAGTLVSFASANTSRLYAMSIFESLLETMLSAKLEPISRMIANSKPVQTIIFMTCSSYILNVLKNHKMHIFWFMKVIPKKVKKPVSKESLSSNSEKLCTHHGKCSDYFIKGLKTYSIIGIVLESIRLIMSKTPAETTGFTNVLALKLLSINFNTMKFLVSYVGIYRASYCLLNNYLPRGKKYNHRVAAFLGGFSYSFNPNMTFLAYAITCCIEMSWRIFKMKKSDSMFLEKIKEVPWDRLCVMIGMGLVIHIFLFHRHMLKGIGKRFVNGTTNYKAEAISKRIQKFLNNISENLNN